ncbi:MAG: hypothetical protein AAB091_00145 [Elusimicrobiota bacterium]
MLLCRISAVVKALVVIVISFMIWACQYSRHRHHHDEGDNDFQHGDIYNENERHRSRQHY